MCIALLPSAGEANKLLLNRKWRWEEDEIGRPRVRNVHNYTAGNLPTVFLHLAFAISTVIPADLHIYA